MASPTMFSQPAGNPSPWKSPFSCPQQWLEVLQNNLWCLAIFPTITKKKKINPPVSARTKGCLAATFATCPLGLPALRKVLVSPFPQLAEVSLSLWMAAQPSVTSTLSNLVTCWGWSSSRSLANSSQYWLQYWSFTKNLPTAVLGA